MTKKEKTIEEFAEQWKLDQEEEAWKLNSLTNEERNQILKKYEERRRKIGSWRANIPVYGLRYEYNGIDAHWTLSSRLFYHAITGAAIVYGLIKLVESFK